LFWDRPIKNYRHKSKQTVQHFLRFAWPSAIRGECFEEKKYKRPEKYNFGKISGGNHYKPYGKSGCL